jgi:hypothetical protein
MAHCLDQQQAASVDPVDGLPPAIGEGLAAVPDLDQYGAAVPRQGQVKHVSDFHGIRDKLGGNDQCVVDNVENIPVGEGESHDDPGLFGRDRMRRERYSIGAALGDIRPRCRLFVLGSDFRRRAQSSALLAFVRELRTRMQAPG